MRFPLPGSPGRGGSSRFCGQDTGTLSSREGLAKDDVQRKARKGLFAFYVLIKALECDLDESRQRPELVAALEHGADARAERR